MRGWNNAMLTLLVAAAAATGAATAVAQQAGTQFVGITSYRVGPYGANGAAFFSGFIDYLALVNERDGGVNGVKLSWEECETEYNTTKGVECYERLKTKTATGPTAIHPMSTGITYSLLDKVPTDKIPLITLGYGRTDAVDGRVFPWVFPLESNYWDCATAIVKFITEKEGGADKLKGKKIVLLYHDSAYGKEPHPVLEAESAKLGFELKLIPVPHPGNEQQSQWLQIRQYQPDWVILWGWGVMNATALKTAQKVGFPRDKMVGQLVVRRGDRHRAHRGSGHRLLRRQPEPGREGLSGGQGRGEVHRLGRQEHDRPQSGRPGAVQPRAFGRDDDRRSGAHGAGQVRQETDDRRAGALGPRAAQSGRKAAATARVRRQ